jgi:glycosyltransferase involved in cell wall biosynthesis
MSELKSAYELASERIIVSRENNQKKEEDKKPVMDFVEIPEFSDREDRVLESNETKLINGDESDESNQSKEDEENPSSDIKIIPSQSYNMDDRFLEVHWNGHFFDYGGFARMNRTMVFGLSNRNVRVKTEIEPYLTHVNSATQKELRRMASNDISEDAPRVFGVTVPMNVTGRNRKILYTMIETSETVHPDYAGKLNLMDEIWVATEYGKKALQKSNVHPSIHVMPLGVDTSRYKPDCGKMDFGPSMKGFKFVSVFRWSYRKGFDILLKAYLEEFSSEEDVSLLLVSRAVERPEEEGEDRIVEDFNAIKQIIGKKEGEFPHVALYTDVIHEKDMPKLYNSMDAFVLISRGEGFCIPYLEAGACGLPVIASNCSGQTDFLNKDNSYLVEPRGYVEASVGGNLSNMAKLCHFYEGQLFPDFDEGSIEQTRHYMRYVFENRKEAKGKANKLMKHVRSNYTWDMAVDRVYRRLTEMS